MKCSADRQSFQARSKNTLPFFRPPTQISIFEYSDERCRFPSLSFEWNQPPHKQRSKADNKDPKARCFHSSLYSRFFLFLSAVTGGMGQKRKCFSEKIFIHLSSSSFVFIGLTFRPRLHSPKKKKLLLRVEWKLCYRFVVVVVACDKNKSCCCCCIGEWKFMLKVICV